MKLHFAVIASYAEMATDGRVSMIGGDIGTLLVPHDATFPVTPVAPIFLVAKLIAEPADLGRPYVTEVRLMAPDGTVLERAERDPVVLTATAEPETKLGFVLNFYNVQYPTTGTYTARIFGNGTEVGAVPLRLHRAPNPNAGEATP